MPLEKLTAEIVLEGLDQKTSAKVKQPGKLRTAVNVFVDKTGELSKRRGYRAIDVTADAVGDTMEAVFAHVGTYEDELLLFGLDFLWSVGSRDSGLDGDVACVKRGPLPRGNFRDVFVASSGESR